MINTLKHQSCLWPLVTCYLPPEIWGDTLTFPSFFACMFTFQECSLVWERSLGNESAQKGEDKVICWWCPFSRRLFAEVQIFEADARLSAGTGVGWSPNSYIELLRETGRWDGGGVGAWAPGSPRRVCLGILSSPLVESTWGLIRKQHDPHLRH